MPTIMIGISAISKLLVCVLLVMVVGGVILGLMLPGNQKITVSSRVTVVSISQELALTSGSDPLGYSSSFPNETIFFRGTSLTDAIFQAWARNFTQVYPSVSINETGFCQSQSCEQLSPGTIDGADTNASAQELDQSGFLQIPLFVSAQAIIYHIQGMPQSVHLNLTGSVLADIYNGTITDWNDPRIVALNPTADRFLPDRSIVPVHQADGSSTTLSFTQYLSEADPTWAKQFGYGTLINWPSISSEKSAMGEDGVVATCNNTAFSIAYVALTYLPNATVDGLGYARVQNSAGKFATLSAGAIDTGIDSLMNGLSLTKARSSDANFYPLANFVYADVLKNQSNSILGLDVRMFLQWAVDPNKGNSPYYLASLNFLPLTPAALQFSLTLIDEID